MDVSPIVTQDQGQSAMTLREKSPERILPTAQILYNGAALFYKTTRASGWLEMHYDNAM
jgi:hypothetical protein